MINSITKAAAALDLANNGKTFSSNMDADFRRNADKLVARGGAFKVPMLNAFGRIEEAYLTPKAFALL